MSEAGIVGMVGLAASVVIALGQTFLANRRHVAQLRHDVVLGDRAELRDVLDGAAQTLRRAMWAIEGVRSAFGSGDYDRIVNAGREGEGLAQDAALDNGRIALRLGREHEVYKRHNAAMDVFIEVTKELMATLPTGAKKYVVPRMEIAKRLDGQAAAAELRFGFARGSFIDAAEKLVGADLPIEP